MTVTLTITKADVIAVASELADPLILDADWTRQIEWAGDEMSPVLGKQSRLDRCGIFLVAHMMTGLLRVRRGITGGAPGGPLSAVTIDKISKTFVTSDAWKQTGITASALQSTEYGREYLRLIRIFVGPAVAVAGGTGPIGPAWPFC